MGPLRRARHFSPILCPWSPFSVCMWMLAASWIGPRVARSQDCPSSRNVSWPCYDLISFKAPSFPRSAKALMVSHPVYACIPIRECPTPSPRPWRSLLMSMYLTRFFVPHFWNKGHDISGQSSEPSHWCSRLLLQQLCSLLIRHELHAKWFLYQRLLGLTAAHCSLVLRKQVSSLATYSCSSFSFPLRLVVFQSLNLMRLALLGELLRNFLHCWTRWPDTIFRNCIPLVLPLFDLSAFLIESSRYVSKTTSILWLLTPSCRRWVSSDSASWENVWSLPFNFWIRLIPSMIVAEGSGMVSADNTCFSNSLARTALFVFLIVPSPLASAHDTHQAQ